MNFISQIFQDVSGSYSSKRVAFFVFILLFVAISVLLFFRAVPGPLVQGTQDHLTDLIKWIGGFIVGEQVTKFAPKANP